MGEIYVTKISGEQELFSEEKLRNALQRASVVPHLIDDAVSAVRAQLRNGIPTGEIYRLAFAYLRSRELGSASRYGLRRAIMDMGPDGHPFEKLVAEIFESQGFTAQTSVVLQGRCVQHEVDVVAVKGDRKIMVECKFHHEQEVKSDVKVALYIQARFEDLKESQGFTEAWLVTNTKLSYDAIQYAQCAGMHAVGWSYPREGSLQNWIERIDLHPITILESITNQEKHVWLENGIVSCRDIRQRPNVFAVANIHEHQQKKILDEIQGLCGEKK